MAAWEPPLTQRREGFSQPNSRVLQRYTVSGHTEPQRGFTTKLGVAVPTAHPRKKQNPANPNRVPHRKCLFGFKNRGMWNPVRIRINSNSFTWGAPQSGDSRLCSETRSGLNHTIFPTNNSSRRYLSTCPLPFA